MPDRARRRNKRQSVVSEKYARRHQRGGLNIQESGSQMPEEPPDLQPGQVHLDSLQMEKQLLREPGDGDKEGLAVFPQVIGHKGALKK